MKNLVNLITQAVVLIMGYKQTIAAQKAEIERLQKIVDDEDFEDEEREAKLAELEALEKTLDDKAEELSNALSSEPAAPTVNPATFEVTTPAQTPEGIVGTNAVPE